MRLTIKEFAEKVGVDGPAATGFVKTAVTLGLATDDGEGPKPARGRIPRVYKFDQALASRVSDLNQASTPTDSAVNAGSE